jgi:hypothetical protein
VEDTANLLGHALRKALALVARQCGRPLTEVTTAAGAPVLAGPSLKAALDLNWDDRAAREQALGQVLAALEAVDAYLATQPLDRAAPTQAQVRASMAAARQVRAQDIEATTLTTPGLRQGVGREHAREDERPSLGHASVPVGDETRGLLTVGTAPLRMRADRGGGRCQGEARARRRREPHVGRDAARGRGRRGCGGHRPDAGRPIQLVVPPRAKPHAGGERPAAWLPAVPLPLGAAAPSAAGVAGGPLLLASDLAVLFGLWGQVSGPAAIAALPIALWEFLLGVWLVVKGFTPSPITASMAATSYTPRPS